MTRVLIGIISNEAARYAEFWACMMRLEVPAGSVKDVAIGTDYVSNQNILAQRCLDDSFDYLWLMGDDHSFGPDLLEKMLVSAQAFDLPILVPLCSARRAPFALVDYGRNPDQTGPDYLSVSLAEVPSEGIIELDAAGSAGMLIRRDVLATVPQPWFENSPRSEDIVFCIPPGAWVGGRRGVGAIEEISVGDLVVTHTGELCEVRDTSVRDYKGLLTCITPAYGDPVRLTPNHRLLVNRDGGRCWVEAGEVVVGDRLCVPKIERREWDPQTYAIATLVPGAADDGATVGYTRTRKSAVRLPSFLEMTPDLARLIGYFIAEGTVGKRRHDVVLCFGAHRTDLVEDAVDLLESIFNAHPTTRTLNGCTRVSVSSAVLARTLCGVCGGSRALDKRLPDGWRHFSTESLSELIKGYWRGDGSYDPRNGFRMTTVSPRLATDLQAAVLELGIYAGVRFRANQKAGRYDIGIPYSQTKAFAEVVDEDASDHIGKDRWSFLRSDEDYFYVRVAGVESEEYEGPVYNLSVVEDESFTISGFAVHNCEKAITAGFKIHADLSCRLGHILTAVVTPGHDGEKWVTGLVMGDLQLAIGTAEELTELPPEVGDPRNRDDNPHPDAEVELPLDLVADDGPAFEPFVAERIELWVDEEFVWWWRAIDHQGNVLKKDSAVNEQSVLAAAELHYPGVMAYQIAREVEDSRHIRPYRVPGRMFNQ